MDMMTSGNYDPKLREVARKIKRLLKRNNVAGSFVVVSKTHSEFRFHFPTWSAVTLKGNELRIRAKREDFVSLEDQKETVENSVHILCQIRDIAGLIFKNMQGILDLLSKKFNITHEGFSGFYPEDEDHLD